MSKPVYKHVANKKEEEEIFKPTLVDAGGRPLFSGIARSVECYLKNGHNNFRIVTMKMENGVVKETKYSDPYAHFELLDRMDLMTAYAIQNLNDLWKDGNTLRK